MENNNQHKPNRQQAMELFETFHQELDEKTKKALLKWQSYAKDEVFNLLIGFFKDSDVDRKADALKALIWLFGKKAIPAALSLLEDPDRLIRWYACGCFHDFGDETAIEGLTKVLRNDPDAQVRTTAAYALGGIGSPAAIPALLRAMESDHEEDFHGHTPSSCAAVALDEILGANETCLQVSGTVFGMRQGQPDLDRLRQLALDLYREWSTGQGSNEPPDGGPL